MDPALSAYLRFSFTSYLPIWGYKSNKNSSNPLQHCVDRNNFYIKTQISRFYDTITPRLPLPSSNHPHPTRTMVTNPTFANPGKTVVKPIRLAHVVLRTQAEKFKEMVEYYKVFLSMHEVHGNEFMWFGTYDEEHHRIVSSDFGFVFVRLDDWKEPEVWNSISSLGLCVLGVE